MPADDPREGKAGPKQKQKHYSYNESVDEAGKLIDRETTDVEHETPSDDRESIETPPGTTRPSRPRLTTSPGCAPDAHHARRTKSRRTASRQHPRASAVR